MASNCAYDALSSQGCQITIEDIWELPKAPILVVVLTLLLVGVLRLVSGRSRRRYEAGKAFALIKPVEKLSPKDLGFQVLRPGERADTHMRPFHTGSYVRRIIVEENDGGTSYAEHELVEEARADRGFVLLGQPLDGKSRTLYEILSRLHGYLVVKPSLSKGLPGDDALSLVEGKNVVLLLEDLHEYVGRQTDLSEYRRVLREHASSCVVTSTCRDGPELRLVEEKLGRLYEEIPLKLKLAPPTADERGHFARSIGRNWDQRGADQYPTLGSIAMERPMEAMSLRFSNLLRERPDYADALRALKLLTAASVRPLTRRRLEAVLGSVFGRTEIHLTDCIRALADQSFLREDGSADGVVLPEPAYLRDAVTYTEGKEPEDDIFPALIDTFEALGDAEALSDLGMVGLLSGKWSTQAAWVCLDRATRVDPNYPSAWLNKTALLSAAGHHAQAVEAAERAVALKPGDYAYWQNKGTALRNAERYEEALASYRRAAELRPDKPEVWRNLGRVYLDLDRPRAALNAFNRSIDLGADYGYVEGWVSRARALLRLGRKREALRAYDRITNMDPDRFKPWFNKAGLLSELGYWEDALLAAEKAESLRPDDANAPVVKAKALYELAQRDDDTDRLREAHQACESATNLDEENVTAWSMKGITLMFLERYDEALEAIERSIALDPDRPQDWFHKGQALLKTVEGLSVSSSAEFAAGMWWLCRAWRARDRLPDQGASAWRIFQALGYESNRCLSDFPSLALLPNDRGSKHCSTVGSDASLPPGSKDDESR